MMGEIKRILNICTECGICLEECDFLQKYCNSPKELAVNYLQDKFVNTPHIPYSCNMCTFCKSICPQGLDIGKMSLEMRQEMVQLGIGPLEQHASIKEAQEFYISDAFKVIIPSEDKNTKKIFFPGCSLSAYSPDIVIKTYEYLNEKLPGIGIMLGCCGGPAYLIGDQNTFKPISENLEYEVKKVGADQIIVACPFCYNVLKQHNPGLNPILIYTVLNEIGIPESKHESVIYNVHDPCTTRYEHEIPASVRSIIKKVGHSINEIPHSKEESHCCGMGGMVYAVDEELGKLRSKRTIDEADKDIVTYCATCRETLQGQGGHVIHVLDLIFNTELENALKMPPNTPELSTGNMKLLKKILTQEE
ncbi:(Fe-S)-binding protein [Methanobacterium sp.]|uniref:(Fe-S)-binding protein n=1 Tax=Methanobacterium sp. TaxID=2164 RepID=UPI003C747833